MFVYNKRKTNGGHSVAMQKGDLIEIIYIDRNNRLSQRRIKLIEMTEHYIKAYCYDRRCVRIFKRENILGLKMTGGH